MRRQKVPQWALDQFAAEQAAKQECERRWPKNVSWSSNAINGVKFGWRSGSGVNDITGELVSPLYYSRNKSPVVDVFLHAQESNSATLATTYVANKLIEEVSIEDVVLAPTTGADSDGAMQQASGTIDFAS